MNAERQNEWVCVAAIAAAHGVRGAFRLKSFTERPEDVAAYGPVFDRTGRRLFTLDVVGPAKGGVVVKVDGIDDRDAAEALRGTELFVPRTALPDPDDDEFYYSDLEGLEAYHTDCSRFGVVKRVVNHGAGDLIEIVDDRGQLHIIPFDKTSVPVIDLKGRRLEVTPRPELVVENEL
ncbi:MAG: ribosome maturation factor RimM [Alphaproteobacteria bacterium]|nr:ribosome maturation factor RimM [Alphaproteobacteria bacterium]